jgi:putative transposase
VNPIDRSSRIARQERFHLPNDGVNTVNRQGKYLTLFQRKLLLKAFDSETRPQYRQRIEIMLLADRGFSPTQICRQLGCAQETARYWMEMARSGLYSQWNQHSIGRPKTINEAYLDRLRELIDRSPRDCGYSFDRWTAGWLSRHLAKEFGIEVGARHICRLLKAMGRSTYQRNSKNISISIHDLHDIRDDRTPEVFYMPNLVSIS